MMLPSRRPPCAQGGSPPDWSGRASQALHSLLDSQRGEDPFWDLNQHLLRHPGKLLRPRLLLAAASMSSTPAPEAVTPAMGASQLIHQASLLHDDQSDRSGTRRGYPTAAARFGRRRANRWAAWLMGRAFRVLGELPFPSGGVLPMDHLTRLALGQLSEALGPMGSAEEAEKSWERIAHAKTAELFQFSLCIGARLTAAPPEVEERLLCYGAHLGLAFQLADDARDIQGTASNGREAGADLSAGLMTWPIILWAARGDWEERIGMLRQPPPDLLSELRDSGVVEETWQEAARRLSLARQAVHPLPASHGRDFLLQVLAGVAE